MVCAAHAGDGKAREELVATFTPLIASVARTYKGSRGIDRAELMQEGIAGLLTALKRYDPDRGTPFWAYAAWWVRQAMQQLVAEMTRPIVLSDRALRQLARVKDARSSHLQANGREPTAGQLADATGLSHERVDSLISVERAPRSLEEPTGGEESDSSCLGELLGDPLSQDGYERVVDRQEMEIIRALTEDLGEREREVVYSHYGLGRKPRTLREIAAEMGLSAERVRQIEERAVSRLRMAATR